MGTYRLRVPASRVVYVPEAQGGLPPGPTYCTYGVHVPASGVGYVPGTVAPQAEAKVAAAVAGLSRAREFCVLNAFDGRARTFVSKSVQHHAMPGSSPYADGEPSPNSNSAPYPYI